MKQKFRFAELYKNNRTAVEKTALPCGAVKQGTKAKRGISIS